MPHKSLASSPALYTDGACRVSNPGVCSSSWVLYDGDKEVKSASIYLGPELHTNNFAEYFALVDALEYLYTNNIRNVTIHCDSELVVNQVNQEWQINEPYLRKMAAKCYGLLMRGAHVLKHIKGHAGDTGNERADELCNAMLDIHMEEYNGSKKA